MDNEYIVPQLQQIGRSLSEKTGGKGLGETVRNRFSSYCNYLGCDKAKGPSSPQSKRVDKTNMRRNKTTVTRAGERCG